MKVPLSRSGRRPARVVAATALLSLAGLVGPALFASPTQAAPTKPQGDRTVANAGTTVTIGNESTTGSTVPAPPKPAKDRPVQRVVPKTTTGPGRSAAVPGGGVTTAAVAPAATGNGAPGAGTASTLVLYDSTGPYAWLGEAYAMLTANLTSHFGSWTAHPVANYTTGELSSYTAVVYIGSTYDEPMPVAFLDDVTTTTKPVIWMYSNIWQLTARDPNFVAHHGFIWKQYDFSSVAQVSYHGTNLTRDANNGAGIMDHVIYDATKNTVLATATRADGSTFPWAIRSGNLTYIGEVPYAYMDHNDRYLAFADLLYDALAPTAPARHRALVRIEDVGPDADPAELRAVADYLSSRKAPFTVAVYPRYRDPKGVNNGGVAEDYTLAQRPQVVSALKYMQTKGGTLLMHGYTHQYGDVANPYDGVSANDFEFYRAHIDSGNNVIYDGPPAEDNTAWATGRVNSSASAFTAVGLAKPTIFEFPHYAGSVADYKVMTTMFGTRYERGLYFPGVLTGGTPDYTRIVGQFFPYSVRDVYGAAVVPENIGNIEPDAFNNHPPRLPADLITSAKNNLAIRDGMASFFYHPYLGTAYLKTTVEGIQGLGYTFVAASATLA